MKTIISLLGGVLIWCLAFAAHGQPLSDLIQTWETANFRLEGEAQKVAFGSLLEKAAVIREDNNHSAKHMLWAGIIEASYAGEIGGLSALAHAKQAKKDLESALELDSASVKASALGSLATLYSKVPGWPVGFGNAKKARALFEQAENEGANTLDFYVIYAEFALDQNDTMLARRLLEKAEIVPTRANRQITDAVRHEERRALLERL